MSLSYIDAGISINGFDSAMIAALVIGFLNLIVRPILVVLTLPVTLISLGLFLFVINAFLFWMASAMLAGFQVQSFPHALLGSLIYSFFGILIDSALERLFSTQRQESS
jgi:putative membrane protein